MLKVQNSGINSNKFVIIDEQSDCYLLKDETISQAWLTLVNRNGWKNAVNIVEHESYEEAERVLQSYLKEKKVNKVTFIKSGKSFRGVCNGKPFCFGEDHVNYPKLVECFKSQCYDKFEELVNPAKAVMSYMGKDVVVSGGVVTYKGEEVHNTVVDRIFEFMREGLPHMPLVHFLEKLMQNPSMQSRASLYDFLELGGFPITESGDFLGYKGLNEDYTDCYTSTVDNRPGAVIPPKERWDVDDDRNVGCSKGYHVGNFDYANSFQKGKLVLVSVNPANVVSVPHDCSHQKCRVTVYQPVEDCSSQITKPYAEFVNDSYYSDEDDDSSDYDDEYDSDDE